MQSGTIVTRRAGHFPPNAFWEAVLAANPHGWGAAIVDEPGQFLLNSEDKGMSLEDLQNTLKTFEDKDITFYFANSETALSIKDLPPYVLAVKMEGEEEIPQVVAFIEGNFPTYAKTGSSHPPEYHLAMEYLQPKIENVYDMCEGDLDKVFAQLEKPFFKKELILTSVSRGTFTLMLANGKSLTFNQGDLGAEYPWGWTSNHHGYTEGGKKKEAAPEKKPSIFQGRSTVREKANVQPSPAIAEAVKAPVSGGAVVKNYIIKRDKPGAHLNRKDRKQWYQNRIGYYPPGWADGCSVNVYYTPDNKLLTFSEFKKLGLEAAGLPPLNNPQRGEGKDTEPSNIPQPPVNNGPAVTTEVLPLMSPETRKHVREMMAREDIKKIVADNADMIHDPKRVQELEAKYADFARQLGAKSIDEFIMWDYEQFLELAKARPDGLAVMAWSFRNIVAYHRTKKPEKVAEKVEETVETVVPPKVANKKSIFARAS